MPGAGEPLSPEQLLRTLERGKQPDTLGSKINQALQLITTILDDLGYASTHIAASLLISTVNIKSQSRSMVGKIVS
jgi:hypothetical protein